MSEVARRKRLDSIFCTRLYERLLFGTFIYKFAVNKRAEEQLEPLTCSLRVSCLMAEVAARQPRLF